MSTTKKAAKATAGARATAATWKTPRKCQYCKAIFTPKRPQDADSRFCEPNHRKMYHRYGAMPFDKLKEALRKEAKREIAAEVKRQLAEPIETMRRDLAELLKVAYQPKGTTTTA